MDNIGSQNESEPRVVNLSGESLQANQALAFGIRKRRYFLIFIDFHRFFKFL